MISHTACWRAFALADAHGHLWAEWARAHSVEAAIDLVQSTDFEVLADLADTWNPGPVGGIGAPTLVGEVIVHVTGSGRLTWEIHPQGEVDLTVSRPDRAVIRARVARDGAVTVRCDERIYARHIRSLAYALDAIERGDQWAGGWRPPAAEWDAAARDAAAHRKEERDDDRG